MDFLTPGLGSKGSRSHQIIRDINSNNRISLQLKAKFKQVNGLTTNFLTNELTAYSQQQTTTQTDQDKEFAVLQETFQDVYYLLNIEDFKFNKVSGVSLEKLGKLYEKVKGFGGNGSIVATNADITDLTESTAIAEEGFEFDLSDGEVLPITQLTTTTNQLINYYTLLTLNLNLSNSIIYKTLLLKNNLIYWEDLNNSLYKKLIYFVQTAPCRLFSLGKSVYSHVNDTFTKETLVLNTSGTEEDNWLYHHLYQAKHTISVVYSSIKNVVSQVFIKNNPAVTLLNLSKGGSTSWYSHVAKSIIRSPLNLVNKEINAKIIDINQQIDQSTTKIDKMLHNLSLDTLESILEILPTKSENSRIFNVINATIAFNQQDITSASNQPTFIARYWFVLLVLLHIGPSQIINAYDNRQEIAQWFKYNFIDTICGFWTNWLVKPVNDMLNILRHDGDLSITSKESLQSDLDSLERMVIDFLADENVTGIDQQQIHQSIQNGDLTLLMSKYESEIRSPVKSLIRGSLIRSLLIQIQKTKVDGGIVVSGIDKLLKSQQLVFGIVSISPSLFIVYKLWAYLTSAKPITINGKQVNIICLKSLNNIENLLVLLSNSKDGAQNFEGQLLIEIINLIITSNLIIPQQLKNDWIRDLNELNNAEFDIDTKLSLVRKIWNMYGPYFR
jgi:nuclear-control-of-ATPase protein 2